MIYELDPDATVARLAAAVPFLAAHSDSTGKVGAIGFCWGGGMVNELAAAGTGLAAGVPYYGRQLPADEVSAIPAPLCLQYAGLDERINAGIDDFVAALRPTRRPSSSSFTRAPTTPSTTTPTPPATTRPQRSWRGAGLSPF